MTTETVPDVLRDFDAMASECGGLEAATIHAMTLRANVAHAREFEALRQRVEVVEADARRYRFLRDSFAWTLTSGEDGARLSVYMVGVSITAIGPGEDEFDAAIDAAIASGGEE